MSWLQARENSNDPPPAFMRVVFGYETLVNNCCDLTISHLEFKPEMLAAKKDAERMGWLEKNAVVIYARDSLYPVFNSHLLPGKETVRIGIDAAMEARK